MSMFINVACLYLNIKMMGELEATKIIWVLFYIQKEVAEAQKDNLLDKLSKRELKVETIEELFGKIRNEFGKIVEEKQKIEQLRTIVQGRRTYNEYIQKFKKVVQESGYER